jgi:hypothetical protein
MSTPAPTLTGGQMEALTGLTERRLRQIAKLGYFPPPERGQFQQTATIRGLFKYYREDNQRTNNSMAGLKANKLQAEGELVRIKVEKARGNLIPVEEVHEVHAYVFNTMVSTFRQRIENDLPLQAEGKTVPEIRRLARAAVDETLRALQRGLEDWDAQRERAQAAEAMADAPPAADAVQAAEGVDE